MERTYTNKTKVPLSAVQGSKLTRRIFLHDRTSGDVLTLTGNTFRGTVKDKRTGNTVASFAFALEPDPITSDPDKVVVCTIDAVTLAGIPAANYNYDIEMVPPEGEPSAVLLMSGTLELSKEVSS